RSRYSIWQNDMASSRNKL
ncbi:multiple antibiotic resistance protein MarA, partial [Escherichia coli FRIK523]